MRWHRLSSALGIFFSISWCRNPSWWWLGLEWTLDNNVLGEKEKRIPSQTENWREASMLEQFLMGLKIKLETQHVCFALSEEKEDWPSASGHRDKCGSFPGCVLPLGCHYLRLLTGTTSAALSPLRPSCRLPTCVPASCPQEGTQNRNGVITDTRLKVPESLSPLALLSPLWRYSERPRSSWWLTWRLNHLLRNRVLSGHYRPGERFTTT